MFGWVKSPVEAVKPQYTRGACCVRVVPVYLRGAAGLR
jgi:hypothetical protein